jgi:hypothetical protein
VQALPILDRDQIVFCKADLSRIFPDDVTETHCPSDPDIDNYISIDYYFP